MNVQATADKHRTDGPVLLLVDLAREYGGHQRMTIRLIASLRRQGLIGGLALIRHPDNTRLETDLQENAGCPLRGVRTIVPPRKDGLPGLLCEPMAFLRLCRAIASLRADALLADPGGLEATGAPVAAAILVGIPSVVYIPMTHSLRLQGAKLPDLRDALALRLLALARRVAVLTPHQERQLAQAGLSRVSVIPNISPAPRAATAATAPRPRPTVALVGRVDPVQKGHDLLLEFLSSRREFSSGFRFRCIGDGEQADTLRERAQRENIDISIDPWDPAWTDSVDVLLMPSRFEGVPLVVLDALAAGIPVAASAVGGLPDLLPPHMLFELDDFDSWQRALAHALRPAARDEALALAGMLAQRMNPAAFDAAVAEAFHDVLR